MELLLSLAVFSLTAIFLALALLMFSPKAYAFATSKDVLSILVLVGLAVVFAVTSSLSYPGIGNVVTAISIAAMISAFFILIITGRTGEPTRRSISQPTTIRLIDKWFPSNGQKMIAYLISNVIPVSITIWLLPENLPEAANVALAGGSIFIGNMIYSIMFWVKSNAEFQ